MFAAASIIIPIEGPDAIAYPDTKAQRHRPAGHVARNINNLHVLTVGHLLDQA